VTKTLPCSRNMEISRRPGRKINLLPLVR
jgi:hypothetical protein